MNYDPCADPHMQALVAAAKPLSRETYLNLSLLLAPVVDALATVETRKGEKSPTDLDSARRAA
jgi:hypothetical protein